MLERSITLAVGTREKPADELTPCGNAGGQVPCSYVLSKKAGVEACQKRRRARLARSNYRSWLHVGAMGLEAQQRPNDAGLE